MKFGIREIIFLIILIAMPLSSYHFVFRPQNAEINEARKEIEHKELMLEQLAAATNKTADLKQANDDIAAGISTIESRLPTNKEVEVILQQVAALAVESQLELPEFKTGKQAPAAGYYEQPLEMEITGDFDDFYTFLLRLEQLDRITRIPEMEIKRTKKDNGSMQAHFTLSIYFEPSDQEKVG
ncbi:MAG: type 4a pilus biogenesis protein PilO [Phycisphaerales bacterium]|nr:type 4a pilus biogenesis protein PilO [Phycisphaerales bacterium]